MRISTTLPFTGVRAGTIFRAGTGYTSDPSALDYFHRAGYAVRAGDAPDGWHTTRPTDPPSIQRLTLPALTPERERLP